MLLRRGLILVVLAFLAKQTSAQCSISCKREFQTMLQDLRREFQQELKETKNAMVESIYGPCSVFYKGICYWAVVSSVIEAIKFKEAEGLCRDRRATLAYPVDATHYELLMSHMRTLIPKWRGYSYFWTSLRFKPMNGLLTIPNGDPAPYVKWFPKDEPDYELDKTRIHILAKSPKSYSEGMFNTEETDGDLGYICHYTPP